MHIYGCGTVSLKRACLLLFQLMPVHSNMEQEQEKGGVSKWMSISVFLVRKKDLFSSFRKAVAIVINATQYHALKCCFVRWIKAINDYVKGQNHFLICYYLWMQNKYRSKWYSCTISLLCESFISNLLNVFIFR